MSRYEWTRGPLETALSPSDFHRRQVTSLLTELAPATGGKLAVLGAGPCHDLDLAALQAAWSRIDLVDIDSALVERGIAAQLSDPQGIGVVQQDLLKASHLPGASGPNLSPTDGPVTAAAATGGRPSLPPPSPPLQQPEAGAQLRQEILAATWEALATDYDVVASTCVLSQLIKAVIEQLGEDHALFVPTVQALRQRHLHRMALSLRPGGTGLLLADFVSSDTLPELFSATPQNLPVLLGQALQANNVFHGMNPGMILKVAREDPQLQSLISTVQMSPPWIWRTGNMAYAIVAIKFVRTPSAPGEKVGHP